MNNIEKLAIEHGSTCYTGQEYHFERWQLEAFVKALQSSEPVALPTFNEISKNIDDSRFVGHPKLNALDTNNVKTGAQIMYDAIYVWLQKQNTSSTVPLEKYNKLLELLKRATKNLEPTCDSLYALLNQAIAEAEGKEG